MLLLADGGHGNPQRRAFNENEINRAILRSNNMVGHVQNACLSSQLISESQKYSGTVY